MRRHVKDLQIMSDLNLTNLLDVSFVLLIAFMLVAPAIKHGIGLTLPKVSVGPLDANSKTLTIAVKSRPAAGMEEPIYIEDQRITLDDMARIVKERRAAFPNLGVLIEADRLTTYETIARILGTLKRNGIDNVGLPTIPEEKKKKSD